MVFQLSSRKGKNFSSVSPCKPAALENNEIIHLLSKQLGIILLSLPPTTVTRIDRRLLRTRRIVISHTLCDVYFYYPRLMF